MTTIQILRDIRASLPKGKKDPWGKCCPSKRVLLQRALRKGDLDYLTEGEMAAVNEFMEHVKKTKKENQNLERVISKFSMQ